MKKWFVVLSMVLISYSSVMPVIERVISHEKVCQFLKDHNCNYNEIVSLKTDRRKSFHSSDEFDGLWIYAKHCNASMAERLDSGFNYLSLSENTNSRGMYGRYEGVLLPARSTSYHFVYVLILLLYKCCKHHQESKFCLSKEKFNQGPAFDLVIKGPFPLVFESPQIETFGSCDDSEYKEYYSLKIFLPNHRGKSVHSTSSNPIVTPLISPKPVSSVPVLSLKAVIEKKKLSQEFTPRESESKFDVIETLNRVPTPVSLQLFESEGDDSDLVQGDIQVVPSSSPRDHASDDGCINIRPFLGNSEIRYVGQEFGEEFADSCSHGCFTASAVMLGLVIMFFSVVYEIINHPPGDLLGD